MAEKGFISPQLLANDWLCIHRDTPLKLVAIACLSDLCGVLLAMTARLSRA